MVGAPLVQGTSTTCRMPVVEPGKTVSTNSTECDDTFPHTA